MGELNLRTGEPTFDATWFIVVGVLLIVFVYVKFSSKLSLKSIMSVKKTDTQYQMRAVAQSFDAKIFRILIDGKECFVFSDSKSAFQLDLSGEEVNSHKNEAEMLNGLSSKDEHDV